MLKHKDKDRVDWYSYTLHPADPMATLKEFKIVKHWEVNNGDCVRSPTYEGHLRVLITPQGKFVLKHFDRNGVYITNYIFSSEDFDHVGFNLIKLINRSLPVRASPYAALERVL